MSGKLSESIDFQVPFPTTAWALLRDAKRTAGAERRSNFDELLRRYWGPLYAFFQSKGSSPADAEDLVQGFLLDIVEAGKLAKVDKPQGRFRDWLVVCARNYLIGEIRKGKARKRKPTGGIVPLDALRTRGSRRYELADGDTPERAFTNAWRRGLVEQALQNVQMFCEERGRGTDFQIFADYYAGPSSTRVTWQDLARRYQLDDWKTAARRADWVKAQLAKAIRRAVREHVDSDEEVDEEIRSLLSL